MLNNWHAPKQRHPEELFPINEIKYFRSPCVYKRTLRHEGSADLISSCFAEEIPNLIRREPQLLGYLFAVLSY